MTPASPSPDTSLRSGPKARPVRAPLIGILTGIVLAGGLGLWTFQRISEAKTLQSDVEVRRTADTERAATLAREPGQVRAVRGVPDTWQPRIELDGTLQAQREALLGFKVGGRLERVEVEVGERVRAGAVLARLDAAEASAHATAADAQVRAAQTALAMAEDGERRTLPLVKNGSFSEAAGVQATQERELALAQLDAARAQHALAKVGVANQVLTAPFPGTLTQVPTGVGGVVTPGQTLFSLVDTSTLKLTTTVSEEDANLLAEGETVRVSLERGELSGRITAILGALDARTRRVPVVAEFENEKPASGPRLRAGAFVRAWVQAKDAVAVLRLPHAVLRAGSRDEVFVVDPAGTRLEVRHVAYAIASDGSLLVRSGLEPESLVVLDPIPEAKAGDAVRVGPDSALRGGVPPVVKAGAE
jgi:RND family efflux transporter MFP subunit